MVFGIDVPGLLLAVIPLLPQTLIEGLPPIFGAVGEWAACVARHGAEAQICQYM